MFEESSETICNMLHSENSTDVIEALRLIAVLHEERLEGEFCSTSNVELVWSSNQEHRKAVVNTFRLHVDGIQSPVMCKTHLCYVIRGNSRLFESYALVFFKKSNVFPQHSLEEVGKIRGGRKGDYRVCSQRVRKRSKTSSSRCIGSEHDVCSWSVISTEVDVFRVFWRLRWVRGVHEFEREARESQQYHSLMEYHSNAHSNITKYLTRASRSKTGTEAITSATSRPDWILVEHVCEILQSVQVEDLSPRLVDTILKSISSVLLYGLNRNIIMWWLFVPLRSSPWMLQCVCVYYQVRLMLWKRNLQRARIRRPEEFLEISWDVMIECVQRNVYRQSSDDWDLETRTCHLRRRQVAVKVLIRAESLASLAKEIRVARASHELKRQRMVMVRTRMMRLLVS